MQRLALLHPLDPGIHPFPVRWFPHLVLGHGFDPSSIVPSLPSHPFLLPRFRHRHAVAKFLLRPGLDRPSPCEPVHPVPSHPNARPHPRTRL
eukprot:scaffold285_cov330-Pavlova_lutheri.AAC.36